MASLSVLKKSNSRLYGVLAPACSGKTTLFNRLRNHFTLKLKKGRATKQLILIDIDEVNFEQDKAAQSINESSSADHRFPLLKEAVDSALEKYPKYLALVITSSPDLLTYLKIQPKKTLVFVQSQSLFLNGIFPLINFDNIKRIEKSDNTDASASTDSTPLVGRVLSKSNSSFNLVTKDDVASPFPVKLSERLAELTGATVTVDNGHGKETEKIDFSKEILNVCESRDRIMATYSGKDNYKVFSSYDDFLQGVIAGFGIDATSKQI